MLSNISRSPKTTMMGLATAAIPVINSLIPILPPQWALIATGVVAGLGLMFSKDANVTGAAKQ